MLNFVVYKVTIGHLRVKHSRLWSKHDFILGVFVLQEHINMLALQTPIPKATDVSGVLCRVRSRQRNNSTLPTYVKAQEQKQQDRRFSYLLHTSLQSTSYYHNNNFASFLLLFSHLIPSIKYDNMRVLGLGV